MSSPPLWRGSSTEVTTLADPSTGQVAASRRSLYATRSLGLLLILAAGGLVLLIAVAENPLNPFASQDVVVIKNAGKPNMEMLVKEGNELKQYQSSGQIGEGQGMKAGVAYRMKDGSMVYVPETQEGK